MEEMESHWTPDLLYIHMTELRKSDQVAIQAALNAADRAVTKAEAAADKRFDGVNEFRQSLSDQQRLFVPREILDTMIVALNSRLDVQRTEVDNIRLEWQKYQSEVSGTARAQSEGKIQMNWLIGTIIAILGIAIAFLALYPHLHFQ